MKIPFNHWWLAVVLGLFARSVPAETVPFASLDLNRMTAGWSTAKADLGIMGRPLRIHGVMFPHGVGTHATSNFRVKVEGGAKRFTAHVGVDDTAGGQGSVEFIVLGDGRILWRSGILKGGDPASAVDVNLAGVSILELRVTDGGDGESNDHADWADAAIEMKSGAPGLVALPPCETFDLRTKSLIVNFQVGDDGRLYQRPIGGDGTNGKLQRDDEFYPPAGDGYIWEPALQVVHADGNTSTALIFEGLTRTNDDAGRELTRIKLHDPAYPLEVTLNFRV